jgi:hypothetical protein
MNKNEFPKYTTKTGLKIGSHYIPPYINNLTPEEERIQRALLGVREDMYVLIEKVVYYGAVFIVAFVTAFLMTRPAGDV